VVTEPIVEKFVFAPFLKACMAVIEKHFSLLSRASFGITAIQVGVVAAAGIATAYALYKYFTHREDLLDTKNVTSRHSSTQLCPAIATPTGQIPSPLR
jgi:hypothetical protein